MSDLQQLAALINLAVSGALIMIGLPLARRKIPMNRWFGVRIPKTSTSTGLWYDINAYAGRQFILCSIPIALAGMGCFFIPFADCGPLFMLATIGPMAIFETIAIIRIILYLLRKQAGARR